MMDSFLQAEYLLFDQYHTLIIWIVKITNFEKLFEFEAALFQKHGIQQFV